MIFHWGFILLLWSLALHQVQSAFIPGRICGITKAIITVKSEEELALKGGTNETCVLIESYTKPAEPSRISSSLLEQLAKANFQGLNTRSGANAQRHVVLAQ